MVLTVQLARSPCVEWKSELPRVGRKCESPIFTLDGCKMQFRLIGSWNEELKCESWELSLKKITTLMKTVSLTGFTAKKRERNSNSKPYQQELNPSPSARSVLAHIENKICELKIVYCGEIYFESEGYNRFFEFNRNNHLNKYGITSDKISMYFVFDSDSRFSQSIVKEAGSTNSVHNEGISSDHMCLQDLSKDMEKLLGNPEHSDLVLKCEDGKFYVNKEILSARSPVFSAMFKDDIRKGETNEVEITDIQTSVLEQFLKYIYSGAVENLSLDSAFTLYEAGEKFEVPLLKKKCSSFIASKISKSNLCQVLLFADKFQDTELLEATISFAVSRESFLGSLIWRTFAEDHPSIAVKVFLKVHE